MENIMKAEVILIAAMDRDHVIGKGNDIPWRGKLPADMAHFQKLTMGGTVVMGRKTWESIPAKYRPLPGRTNIVLTRDANWSTEGALVVHDAQSMLTGTNDKIWIIGGAEIYREFLPLADRLELTLIDTASDGDTFFPSFDPSEWNITVEPHESDEKNLFPYIFQTFVRK